MAVDICMPHVLSPGATVGIVSLASPVERERLDRGIRFLERKGCRVVVGASALRRHGYLAGNEHERVADLHTMAESPLVHGILASKGGYGCARLLDIVHWRLLTDSMKPFAGFSDMTAFQLALLSQSQLGSFYGPMVGVDMRRPMPAESERSFWNAVQGKSQQLRGICWRTGRAEGRLMGGCLSVLTSILGSKYFPDVRGAILFLEDVEEQPYRIDRMLNQLRLAGVFRKITGLAFGRFVRCGSDRPGYRGPSTLRVLRDAADAAGVPAVGELPFGHIRMKMTLPVGKPAILDGVEGELLC